MVESKNVISTDLLHTLSEAECCSELGDVHVQSHSTVFFHFCVNSLKFISLSHLNLDFSQPLHVFHRLIKPYTFS